MCLPVTGHTLNWRCYVKLAASVDSRVFTSSIQRKNNLQNHGKQSNMGNTSLIELRLLLWRSRTHVLRSDAVLPTTRSCSEVALTLSKRCSCFSSSPPQSEGLSIQDKGVVRSAPKGLTTMRAVLTCALKSGQGVSRPTLSIPQWNITSLKSVPIRRCSWGREAA